jgi:deoxyribonucleoside regulator
LEERTVAAGGDAMRRAALRVGVGWGAAKALPSIGAIRAGLINTLVTDEECAREMLEIIAGESAHAAASMPAVELAAS